MSILLKYNTKNNIWCIIYFYVKKDIQILLKNNVKRERMKWNIDDEIQLFTWSKLIAILMLDLEFKIWFSIDSL